MDDYLRKNSDYWQKGYVAENVESWVFRPYGRILAAELGMDGSGGEKLMDFGCGQGAAMAFFKRKGFDVYGVDISETDIAAARTLMPDIHDHFHVANLKPNEDDLFFGGGFDVIVSIQSLYYYTNTDFDVRMKTLNNMLKPGGYVYFTMMGKKCWFYDHATEVEDGLHRIDIETPRIKYENYYIMFADDEEDLKTKFSMFEPLHVGFYSYKTREDEGTDFHYTFFGRKPKEA